MIKNTTRSTWNLVSCGERRTRRPSPMELLLSEGDRGCLSLGLLFIHSIFLLKSFHLFSSDVGVAGFLLGGGLSFLGPSSGFGCDTFRSLDVVLPSGAIVTATAANQHKDLFRALKGGGSRFGIVTHFEVDAIHVGTKDTKDWYGGAITVSGASKHL